MNNINLTIDIEFLFGNTLIGECTYKNTCSKKDAIDNQKVEQILNDTLMDMDVSKELSRFPAFKERTVSFYTITSCELVRAFSLKRFDVFLEKYFA